MLSVNTWENNNSKNIRQLTAKTIIIQIFTPYPIKFGLSQSVLIQYEEELKTDVTTIKISAWMFPSYFSASLNILLSLSGTSPAHSISSSAL